MNPSPNFESRQSQTFFPQFSLLGRKKDGKSKGCSANVILVDEVAVCSATVSAALADKENRFELIAKVSKKMRVFLR